AREILDRIRENGWDPSDFSWGKNSGLFTFVRQFAFQKSLSRYRPPSDRIRGHFSEGANWPSKKSKHAKAIAAMATADLAPRLNRLVAEYDRGYPRALSAEAALRNLYVFGLITDIARKLKEYKDENNLMLLADAPKFLNGVI